MGKRITQMEMSYLAGIFDGEGCITINQNQKGYKLECLLVTAGSYIPNLFQFTFGGSLRKRKQNTDKRWHDYYRWQISSRQALSFLKVITPYLRLKKPQAELAIKFQERLSANHLHHGRRPLTNKELVLREADAILMKSLKKQSYSI